MYIYNALIHLTSLTLKWYDMHIAGDFYCRIVDVVALSDLVAGWFLLAKRVILNALWDFGLTGSSLW